MQLFFGADAKNVVTACSTSLLPQSGQAISPSSYCNVSVSEKAFWQEWQKYSYYGMVYLLLMKIYGGIVRRQLPKTGAHAGSCGSVGEVDQADNGKQQKERAAPALSLQQPHAAKDPEHCFYPNILQKFFHLSSLLRLGMATWEDITAGAQRWKWPEGTPCVHTRVTTSKPQVRCKAVHMFCKWKVGPFYLLTGGRRGGRLVQPPGSPHRGSKHAPASTTPSIRTLSIAFPFTLLEYSGPFTSGRTVQS